MTEGNTITIPYTYTGAGGTYTITTAGTATAGSDYTAPSASLVLADGTGTAVTGSITIATTDDALYEGTETFTLTATNAGDMTDFTSAVATINDNDSKPSYTLSASPNPVTESSTSKATVTATLSAVSGVDTVVTLNTGDGTAVSGSDYTPLIGSTITIPAGSLTGTKDILITNDGVKDQLDTESFTVNGSATNVLPTVATTTVSIADAQTTPKLTLSGGGSGAEGTTTTFTVTADHASELPITVQWAAVDTTPAAGNWIAVPGDDFTYPTNRTATIPAGSTSATISIPLIADSLDEFDEDYAIQISDPTNAVLGTTTKVTGTITDTDSAPTVTITPTTVTEGDSGRKSQTFTATLSAKSGKTIKVDWATAADGSGLTYAVAGKDYVKASGRLTFPPATLTQTFTVDIIGDTIDEGAGETFRITTTAIAGETPAALSASGPAIVTITDDDLPPTISFGDTSAKEGDGPWADLIPVKLTGSSDHAIGFTVTDLGTGTASDTPSDTPGSGDYSVLTSDFTIQPEATAGYAVVMVNGDTTFEPDETVKLQVDAKAGILGASYLTGVTTASSTFTLTNDDASPNLEINSITGHEGDTVDVTGTVTGVSQTDTTLNVTFAGKSEHGKKAADENDFTNPGAKAITIPAGTVSGTVLPVASIPLTDDKVAEPAETIVGSGIGLGNVGSVTDGVITIAPSDGGKPQPGGNGAPTITVPAVVTGAVAVTISGKADPGSTVELWAAPMGATEVDLTKINDKTVGDDGTYKFSRWIGQGTRFQTKVGDKTSDEMSVKVMQAPVFVAASPSKGVVTLAVQGNPRGAGQTVIVQRWSNGAWVNTAWRGTTGSDNTWKATVKPASGSSWTLRAFVAGYTPTGILPGYSTAKKVTVK